MTVQTHDYIEVSDATFDQLVLKADLPVIVDFWAESCGPCRQLAPVIEKIATEYKGRLVVAKVDVEHNLEQFGKLKMRGIPAVLFFFCGELIDTKIGSRTYQQFQQIAADFLTRTSGLTRSGKGNQLAEAEYARAVAAAEKTFTEINESAMETWRTEAAVSLSEFHQAAKEAMEKLQNADIEEDAYNRLIQSASERFANSAEAIAANEKLQALTSPARQAREAALAAASEAYERSLTCEQK